MNRIAVTLAVWIAVVLVVGVTGWLRSRGAVRSPPPRGAPPAEPAGPVGPPLTGTSVPLPAVLEPHRARLEALLAPAAQLAPRDAAVAQLVPRHGAVARLGGAPRLPPGVAWPSSPSHPMSFIGELDLAALHRAVPDAAPLLPASGRLALFYDVEEMRWGFEPKDGAFFRLLLLEGDGPAAAAPGGATAFKERLLGAKAARTLPHPEELEGSALGDDADDAYAEYAQALLATPDHRVGGHPDWIQGDDREEAALTAVGGSAGTPEAAAAARAKLAPGAAKEWRLLWQVDTDDDAGFMWGDAGRLYLLMRDADLKAKRFDRAWLVLQCY